MLGCSAVAQEDWNVTYSMSHAYGVMTPGSSAIQPSRYVVGSREERHIWRGPQGGITLQQQCSY